MLVCLLIVVCWLLCVVCCLLIGVVARSLCAVSVHWSVCPVCCLMCGVRWLLFVVCGVLSNANCL